MKYFLISILTLTLLYQVIGQQNENLTLKKLQELVDNTPTSDTINNLSDQILEEILSMKGFAQLNDTSLLNFQKTLDAYFNYRTFGYEHRADVFRWQLFSTKFIFFTVMLLLLAGLYFSWIQFSKSIKKNQKVKETEIELSMGAVKVKSSVIGLLILIISLAFFYLYLVHIYPIRNVF